VTIALSTVSVVHSANATTNTTASASPTANDWVFAFCTSNQGAPTFSDSQSMVWTPYSVTWGPTGGSRNFTIYGAYAFASSATARTFTATIATSGQMTLSVTSFSGLATSSPFDQYASGNGDSSSLSTGQCPVTSYPNELLLGFAAMDGTTTSTWTAGSGYSPVGGSSQTGAGSSPPFFLEYQVVSATGQYSALATSTTSNFWDMGLVTFADTPVVPASQPPPFGWDRQAAQVVLTACRYQIPGVDC
jgi:hypothetical protein